ncbi:MAG: hypothetical protein HXX15_11240 [Rhodopseudomonas sp.]|uniref:hypothetical protein n=1 Tax=Rhodopseudomonas sp. TaxID=1078 RepID=UPI00178D7B61|nr:hypothetical protein [Rhodopseudomonas sp.]NVN86650.1 hypothetical protein [Rhodopseudomonas sp.]
MSSRRGNGQQQTARSENGGPGEAASYLAEAIADLAHLARIHRLDMLCYLLEMALLEAQEMVRLRGARSSPSQHGK